LLSDGGELIFITPRSFASGTTSKHSERFFSTLFQLEKIPFFNSRKETLDRDNVLQETVIIKAIREKIDPHKNVMVLSSE
jgi:adenine-specific DNA-methyltransferase